MNRADVSEAVSLQGHYAGSVTRLAAFALDQSVATFAFSVTTALVVWTVALVTDQAVQLDTDGLVAGVALYGLWLVAYYAYPWSMSGKTIGMAVLGIRVVSAEGAPCSTRAAVLRVLALPLSFLTLGIGFLPILFGRHRRALHDHIAGTAVVYSWDARAARWRFLAKDRDPSAVDALGGAGR